MVVKKDMTNLAKLAVLALVLSAMGGLAVAQTAPVVPTIVTPANNSNHTVNQQVTFEGSATGGEAPYSYAWDFGDGSNGLGRIFEKTYTSTGNRTVELTVTDFAGRIAETSIQVSITSGGGPGPSAPTISNVRVTDITQTSVIVRWETNIPADSRVIYDTVSHPNLGTEPNFGYANSTGTSNTDPKVTEHAVQISGLSANTTYYFRALSRS
jgi:PKD repeat protein